GDIEDMAGTVAEGRRRSGAGFAPQTISHLVAPYGFPSGEVLALCAGQPGLAPRLADDSPVIGAELVWAARHEMAVTLADAVIRRTPLGALGYPGDAAIERATAVVGDELAWSDERRRREMDEVRGFYGTLNALKT